MTKLTYIDILHCWYSDIWWIIWDVGWGWRLRVTLINDLSELLFARAKLQEKKIIEQNHNLVFSVQYKSRDQMNQPTLV